MNHELKLCGHCGHPAKLYNDGNFIRIGCTNCRANVYWKDHISCINNWNVRVAELSRWISVEDKLPTEKGRYLVYLGESIVISAFYPNAPEPHFYAVEATHWMPLPSEPEKYE